MYTVVQSMHLQEIELVLTILQSFSFTLSKSFTCPFCTSPSGVHLRELTVVCATPHLSL